MPCRALGTSPERGLTARPDATPVCGLPIFKPTARDPGHRRAPIQGMSWTCTTAARTPHLCFTPVLGRYPWTQPWRERVSCLCWGPYCVASKSGSPRGISANHISGPMDAKLLQRRRGETGGVTRLTDHDDL